MTLFAMVVLLLAVLPLPTLQDGDNTAVDGVVFASERGDVAFVHPADWTVTEDAPREFFIEAESGELVVFLRIVGLDQLPPLEDGLSPTSILEYYFEDAGYSSPETVEISEGREGAIISDSSEAIWTFLVDRDNFVLLFVTAAESVRDDNAAAITQLARTLVFGEDAAERITETTETPSSAQAADAADTEFPGSGQVATLELTSGMITITHPERWEAQSDPSFGMYVGDSAQEEISIILFDDLTNMIDLLGVSGNPNEIFSARELVDLVVESYGIDAPVEEYNIGAYRVASLDFSGDVEGFLMYGVAVDDRTILGLVAYGATESLADVEREIEALIASIEYTAQ